MKILSKILRPHSSKPRTSLPEDKIGQTQNFCILPWIHLNLDPSGQVFPCCISDPNQPVSDLNRESLNQAWNSSALKEIRRAFLKDQPVASCQDCQRSEKNQTGSFRKYNNLRFGHHYKQVPSVTAADGALDQPQFKYLDVRFSNRCNFKCRTCGPQSSHRWLEDIHLLHPERVMESRSPRNLPQVVTQEIFENLDQVEVIYFAGGEPLIMDEHYHLLERLIGENKTHVELIYNTNLSCLEYKGWSSLDLWSHFPKVQIHASLDGSGSRGEYLRHGLKWDRILDNRKRLKALSHLHFQVTSTLSCLNVLHLPDFYLELVESAFISEKSFFINPVHHPRHYSTQVLPSRLKEKVRRKYSNFLRRSDLHPYVKKLFYTSMRAMESEDRSNLWAQFLAESKILDRHRGEDLFKTFPELDLERDVGEFADSFRTTL